MQEFQRYATLPLDELTPYPGNARRNNVDELVKSIKRNGQYRTIVVREVSEGPMIILAGNHTTEALRKMGEENVRAEVLRCTDEEARRINLADNRYNDLATYDEDAMAALLAELNDDFEGTGWDAKAAEKYLKTEPEPPIPEQDPTFGVIINCETEDEQAELLERLTEEGLQVRALMG
jgi:hypothetical protein